jgi:hypothetical protein
MKSYKAVCTLHELINFCVVWKNYMRFCLNIAQVTTVLHNQIPERVCVVTFAFTMHSVQWVYFFLVVDKSIIFITV